MNPQEYTINIRPGWGISQVVKVSQGDVGRPLAFTIMDGQDAITLSSTATVTITGTKPSGLGFTQDCTLSGNTASIDTVATMTQEAGSVPAELIVTDGSTVIGTANFVMYVEPAAHPEGTTDGDAETARDLMTRATAAVEQAETYAQQAQDAAESIEETGISAAGAAAGQVPTANGSGGWNWADQEGGGTSDDIENASSVTGSTVTDALDSLSDEIASLSSGAPTPAATVSAMVDTTKIYLYTGSETGYNAGHWYYYSGGAWVDGGQYGEAASMSAGVKAALLACFQKVAWIDENGQTYYDNLYDALFPPANLVSINAVYTQSGSVYDTDTLDSLRTDLTVTALYSDQSTETITDYALTGTLTQGISEITVSYGGQTDTFNVIVSHDAPEIVTAINLPYGAYVDTGYIPTAIDNKYLIGVQYLDENYASNIQSDRPFAGVNRLPASTIATEAYWHVYFASRPSANTPQNQQGITFKTNAYKNPNEQSITRQTANGDTSETVANLVDTPFYFYVSNGSSMIKASEDLTVDLATGTFASISAGDTINASNAEAPIDSFYLGKVNQCGSRTTTEFQSGVKIFCFKVWDANDTPLVNMHAATYHGAVGMYDSVRNQFYAASGTGATLDQ